MSSLRVLPSPDPAPAVPVSPAPRPSSLPPPITYTLISAGVYLLTAQHINDNVHVHVQSSVAIQKTGMSAKAWFLKPAYLCGMEGFPSI